MTIDRGGNVFHYKYMPTSQKFSVNKFGERGVIHILAILILLAGIIGGLYLVQHPTIFRPKAAVSGPRIEVVDASGNPITSTTSQNVKVKLTYVAPSPSVSPSPTPSQSPSPNPTTDYKRVFLTPTRYNGNLGGLSGADQKCQVAANTANWGGVWKAWLSDGTTSAADRLSHFSGRYVKPANTISGTGVGIVVANSWNDLVTIGVRSAIDGYPGGGFNSNGTAVWTNTNTDGYRLGSNIGGASHCNNWTSSSSNNEGSTGLAWGLNPQWTRNTYNPTQNTDSFHWPCNSTIPLYCFEQ